MPAATWENLHIYNILKCLDYKQLFLPPFDKSFVWLENVNIYVLLKFLGISGQKAAIKSLS